MFSTLKLLSKLLDVPLQGIGWYLAQHIEDMRPDAIAVPGLPWTMDALLDILPTNEEISLLTSQPFADEMGYVERWVLAIGKVKTARKRVESMRTFVWDVEEIKGLNQL